MLLKAFIEQSWDSLSREADLPPHDPSLIPLPFPYVVTGDEQDELHYWDSYFIILGLLSSGRSELAKHMLSNFGHLIDTYGYVPQGNRLNHLSHSHPPVFALMVNEVARHTRDADLYVKYTPHVLKEYLFWMRGAELLNGKSGASERVVILAPNVILNRYWDEQPIHDDGAIPQEQLRETGAAAESGWNSSSRWFEDSEETRTLSTTHFLPVDLNCLMWAMENFLALSYEGLGQDAMGKSFHKLKDRRRDNILKYCWDPERSVYTDHNWANGQTNGAISLAMLYPLFVGIATKKHATAIAKRLPDFLKPGGLVSTLSNSGLAWDAPYSCAPLQWVAYTALKNYGLDDLATSIAKQWTSNVGQVYQQTGRLYRYYNVVDVNTDMTRLDDKLLDGNAWTNGVLARFSIPNF
jgi:alpha,alpha-trehalase